MLVSQTGQRGRGKLLSFQVSWFEKCTWLHYGPEVKDILCFYCMTTSVKDVSSLAKKRDDAFCSVGFTNWKNAISRFKVHERSGAHIHAVNQLKHIKSMPFIARISVQKATEQVNARVALMALLLHRSVSRETRYCCSWS